MKEGEISTEAIKQDWQNVYSNGEFFYLGAATYPSQTEGREAAMDHKHYAFTILTKEYREITLQP